MTKISQNHRANLEKLATYLEKLPKDYEHFDMSLFFSDERNTKKLDDPPGCGAVACAIGHGPAAGIPLGPKDIWTEAYYWPQVHWFEYSIREFGGGQGSYWLFDIGWEDSQPTHRDAAARIWYYLDNDGPPKGFKIGDDRWTVY